MSLWPYVRPGSEGRDRLGWRYDRTLDPGLLGAVLKAHVPELDLDLSTLGIRPVAYKKDRFIVAIEGRTWAGRRVALAAKGFADDRAAAIHANHVALWEGGLGDPGGSIRTTRPIAVVPSLGLALSEWLPGHHPQASDAHAAARAGEAAAFLHGCPARLRPVFTPAGFLDNLDRHARLLSARAPDLGAVSEDAARRLRGLSARIDFQAGTPVNGDLSLGNFLIDGTTTYLIDWDISCDFDRAWDVGHFLTQLRRFGLERGQASDGSRAAFITAYGRASGDAPGADFPRRVAFFEAAACLHKAYSAARVGRADWHGVASALLAAALDVTRKMGRDRPRSTADTG
jgi:hypothetical protein